MAAEPAVDMRHRCWPVPRQFSVSVGLSGSAWFSLRSSTSPSRAASSAASSRSACSGEGSRRAELRAQNAPTIDGDYIGIIHPYTAYDLMRDPDWRDPHKYADTTNLYEGEIGKIGRVRFVQSTEAKIWRDSTCPAQSGANPAYYAVFASLFFGDGAYGTTEVEGGGLQTIVKQKGSAGTADPLYQRSSVGWKALKTAEILLPSYLIRVEHMTRRYSATASAN